MLIPEQVWVPAHPGRRLGGGAPRVRIELRYRGGRPVAVVFSSVARLVVQLGGAQPWMVMDSGRLRACLAAAGVGKILLDPDLGESPGRWELADLHRVAGGVRYGFRVRGGC